jgi:FkbM family methyltransferase
MVLMRKREVLDKSLLVKYVVTGVFLSAISLYLCFGGNVGGPCMDTLLFASTGTSSTPGASVASSKGSITCDDVRAKFASGEWFDPNQGALYARKVVTDPEFYVSVHNESYDALRWEHIFLKGKYYEDVVQNRFLHILQNQPSSYVIDVGVNIGYYTLLSAALGHHVIAGFEINPANLARVCESLRINDYEDHVNLFLNGASDVHGQVMQVVIPKNPGEGTMTELNEGNTNKDVLTTTTVTLDEFGKAHGWFDQPDFQVALLKLDVEGMEPQIVHGAQKLLQSGKVANVLVEFRKLEQEVSNSAVQILLDAGYTMVVDRKKTKNVKLTREETLKEINKLKEWKYLKRAGKYVDLWFQR